MNVSDLRSKPMRSHAALAGVFALTLAACGGVAPGAGGSTGSSSSPSPTPATPAPTPAATTSSCVTGVQLTADTSIVVGKTAGAVIAGCTGPVSNPVWTQTSGTTIPLTSATTQAISIEPPAAGSYGFRVDYVDATGAAGSQTFTLTATVPAASTSSVTARADQAMRMGGSASVRAWPTLASGDALASVRWSRISGPDVTLDTSDSLRAIFTAPTVTQDSVLHLRVTLTTTAGIADSDDVYIVIEQSALPASNAIFADTKVGRVHPYRATSSFASALGRCVYSAALVWSGSVNTMCKTSELPLIDQSGGVTLPSVDAVMDRVLVSHDWMGANLEAFLRQQDPDGDFRRLLGSVNAVIVGAHVRPSFYSSATGAIYLDADNLWLTPAERDVIDESPDFRSSFDSALNYAEPWRYVSGNQYASPAYPETLRTTRSLGNLVPDLASLLYHELGHANDFFPTATRAALDGSIPIWSNGVSRISARLLPSDVLTTQYPLQSAEEHALAQVKFAGVAANATQSGYTPLQVSAFFTVDGATDEYNYLTQYEDLAMLFEEFMMATRRGIRRDVAFTTKYSAGMTGADLAVAWGQRGRIADANVKPRIKLALAQMAPWIDPALVDALPAPIAMRAGESWTANLSQTLPASVASRYRASAYAATGTANEAWLIERNLRRRWRGDLPPLALPKP